MLIHFGTDNMEEFNCGNEQPEIAEKSSTHELQECHESHNGIDNPDFKSEEWTASVSRQM